MHEILRTEIGGMPIAKDDLILVLRNTSRGYDEEQAGFVHSINNLGQVFVDYGGFVNLLNDQDQIRPVPENERDLLASELHQREEAFLAEYQRAAGPLISLLEEYHANRNFFRWAANSFQAWLRDHGL